MSWDEWLYIKKHKYVQSDSRHNSYQDQQGGTCYGDVKTALHYAIEVPIWNGHPDPENYVGVVIEVPKAVLRSHGQHPGIHANEHMHFGPLPASHITRAWAIRPTHIARRTDRPELVGKIDYEIVPIQVSR